MCSIGGVIEKGDGGEVNFCSSATGSPFRDALFDSSLFTETWSFCLFFSPIVTAVEKKQLMAAALTAEQRELLCTARKKQCKEEEKKTGDFFIWNHFLNTV